VRPAERNAGPRSESLAPGGPYSARAAYGMPGGQRHGPGALSFSAELGPDWQASDPVPTGAKFSDCSARERFRPITLSGGGCHWHCARVVYTGLYLRRLWRNNRCERSLRSLKVNCAHTSKDTIRDFQSSDQKQKKSSTEHKPKAMASESATRARESLTAARQEISTTLDIDDELRILLLVYLNRTNSDGNERRRILARADRQESRSNGAAPPIAPMPSPQRFARRLQPRAVVPQGPSKPLTTRRDGMWKDCLQTVPEGPKDKCDGLAFVDQIDLAFGAVNRLEIDGFS
jgi:hypothetical protein